MATLLIALNAIFRSYPCIGDVAFYLALLPMWQHVHRCELLERKWKGVIDYNLVFIHFSHVPQLHRGLLLPGDQRTRSCGLAFVDQLRVGERKLLFRGDTVLCHSSDIPGHGSVVCLREEGFLSAERESEAGGWEGGEDCIVAVITDCILICFE